MSDGSPTRRGTAWGDAFRAPGARRLRVSSNPLFRTTRAVASASPGPSGTGITETVPAIMLAMYWVSAVLLATGLGPWGLGPAPNPFALVTNNVRPSRATVTVVGYHAVGINPATRGASAAAEGPSRSTTAISLFPALEMKSRSPSGLTARPSGMLPSGAPGYGASEIVPTTRSLTVSTTEMLSSSVFAT